MYVTRHELALTAATTGDMVQVQTTQIYGRVLSIHVIQPAALPFATTTVFTIKTERTGQTIWGTETLTTTGVNYTRLPRQVVHTSTGGAIAFATAGSVMGECFFVGDERLTVSATAVVAGNSATLIILTE